MKRTLLLALMLVLTTSIYAQNRLSFIRETFESDVIPSDWSVSGEGQGNWSIWPTNQAGGDHGGEIKLKWSPAFVGTARFVSPTINTTGIEEMTFAFKAFLDYYGQNDNCQLGIATSSDNGTTWNTGWEDTFDYYSQGQYSFIKTISTSDIGKENVQFCIYYTGDSNNLNAWYFDDIEIYSLDELNLSMLSTTFPNLVGIEANNLEFMVQNTGISVVETFEASYQINDETPVVETFTSNIASTALDYFTFQTPISLYPGTYTITISLLTVNGAEDITLDNVITKDVIVAVGSVQRTPLIEHFSSSTCGPCVYTNGVMNILTNNNPGKYSYVKYAMNWPGTGDPYCTDEGLMRKSFYNAVYAPQLFLDGVDQGAQPVETQSFNDAYNTPAYVDVRGAFNIEGNTVNITADVIGLVNIPSARLYISINEKTTTGNVGSNGETEFHHIMMKMLNNAEGEEIELKVGEQQHFEYSFDISETHVEEMFDLEVAAWIQNYETHEGYNSHFLYEYISHPYPVQNFQLTIDSEPSFTANWETPEQGSPIGYDIYHNSVLIAENITETSYLFENVTGLNMVGVVANYQLDSESIQTIELIDIDGEAVTPCLAPTNLDATVEQDAADYEHNFKVTLKWDAVDNVKEYVVYIDDEIPANTTETSYIVGYDEEGEHEFKVVTICEDGVSEPSEVYEFKVEGVSIDELEDRFEIYPNPAKDRLIIKSNGNVKEINIYDIVGINIYNEKISVDRCPLTVDLNTFNSGIYFIRINTDKGEFIKQFIKE